MAHQLNMSSTQFNKIARKLELSMYALRFVIGVTQATAYRYKSGAQAIPEPVARLMLMLAWHGIPPEWRHNAPAHMKQGGNDNGRLSR